MKKIWAITILMMLVLVASVSASDVSTDRLNFYEQQQHTINITNTEGGITNAVATMPTGFTFISSAFGCTNPSGQTINCNSIPDDGSATFVIQSPVSGNEYELYALTTTLNGTSLNDVNFINIKDNEIFHTLVEYGRGRGNYFYDSMGTTTSAGTGTGYNYVPLDTKFELNYLHKVYNVKQYYNLATSRATDVQFTCVYPYHTVVRSHLVESMTDDSNDWTIQYSLPRIDGSWERMGFLGMDFDVGDYNLNDSFTINCSNLQYTLSDAHGNIVVDEDSFNMNVRSPDPVSVLATSGSSSIGNGTSEVEVTFAITNDEVYPMDKTVIEIQAPENAQWIGVRGELWGSAQDKYRYELTTMEAGQTEIVTLVARFDTSTISDTSLLLSKGIKVQFVPTWELNSYNPMTYIQDVAVSEVQNVNYGVSSSIIGLQDQIDRIETNTLTINNTVNLIQTLVEEINTTTHDTNSDLANVNSTIMNELDAVNLSLSNQMTSNFNSLTSDISGLSTQITNLQTSVDYYLNCTANPGNPICVRLTYLNTSIDNMNSNMLSINSTLTTQIDDVNTTIMNELSTQFASVESNFTYTNSLIDSINTSINANIDSVNTSLSGDIADVQTTVNNIESDVADLNADLLSINSSLVSQMNSNTTSIINAVESGFGAINDNAEEILTELGYMQDFNEELIFLVTDSVGLANAGEESLASGDTQTAIDKLQEAENKLLEASDKMQDAKKPIENNMKIEMSTNIFSKLVYQIKGLFL